MVVKINPELITDDMMYEGIVQSQIETALIDQIKEDQLWGEIRRAAKKNTALQSALDHAIMIYKLSKEYTDGI
jgi:hypothetical protein